MLKPDTFMKDQILKAPGIGPRGNMVMTEVVFVRYAEEKRTVNINGNNLVLDCVISDGSTTMMGSTALLAP